MLRRIGGVLALVALAAGCESDRDHITVERYFSGGRVGTSPDAGLYQRGIATGQWDLVAVIHSMTDDMDFCQTIVDALKAQQNLNTYSCRLLN